MSDEYDARAQAWVANAITLIPVPYDEDITPGERRTLLAVTADLLRAEARLARLADREAS